MKGKNILKLEDLVKDGELFYPVALHLPVPMLLAKPDGTALYVNRPFLKLYRLTDEKAVVGKYKLLHGTGKQMQTLRSSFKDVLSGKSVSCDNFPIPTKDLISQGIIEEQPLVSALMDLSLYPVIGDKDNPHLILCIYMNTRYKNKTPETKGDK